MTRFIVCLDGTWNNAASPVEREDGTSVYRPSNVLKLARAAQLPGQVTYYDSGVGAMNRAPSGAARALRFTDNALGGALGAGFEVNIEEAYTFLANNWNPGDEIFVFGFSRGASQARSLVRFIEWVGGFPQKQDAFFVPHLFTDYIDRMGDGSGQEFWDARNETLRKRGGEALADLVPAGVKLLAVWDTVLAIGTRFWSRTDATSKRVDFHTSPTPPAIAERVVHAIAIDEQRHDFRAEVFSAPNSERLEQRWFAGVHSNVGGGLRDDSLANCALHWFVEEAREKGAQFDAPFLEHFVANPSRDASEKTTGYKVLDTVLRPVRGFKGERDLLTPEGMKLDPSVIERLNQRSDYRPENLRRFLRRNPQLHASLKAEVRRDFGL